MIAISGQTASNISVIIAVLSWPVVFLILLILVLRSLRRRR